MVGSAVDHGVACRAEKQDIVGISSGEFVHMGLIVAARAVRARGNDVSALGDNITIHDAVQVASTHRVLAVASGLGQEILSRGWGDVRAC